MNRAGSNRGLAGGRRADPRARGSARQAPGIMRVMGTMSGTSLDGVDAAMIETDGRRITGFGPSGYRPYSDWERSVLRAALGRWDGPQVAAAARVVEAAHIELLLQLPRADLVGFHGQTLAHDPHGRGTLQAGLGDAIAQALDVPVVWDFRSDDVAFGGQGAPLAPFYHFACAAWIGASAPLAIVNLGGVGNLTWIDPSCPEPETPGALLAFDTGPANAPIDDLMMRHFGKSYDEDGQVAAAGQVNEAAVSAVLGTAFYSRMPPKSLDRNDFVAQLRGIEALPVSDAIATLCAVCAASVAAGMQHCPVSPERMLVTGGGRHNPVLMEMLGQRVNCGVQPIEMVGLNGDMLEAQAFAFLAARVISGLPTSAPGTTGVPAPVGGGMIARPD